MYILQRASSADVKIWLHQNLMVIRSQVGIHGDMNAHSPICKSETTHRGAQSFKRGLQKIQTLPEPNEPTYCTRNCPSTPNLILLKGRKQPNPTITRMTNSERHWPGSHQAHSRDTWRKTTKSRPVEDWQLQSAYWKARATKLYEKETHNNF